MVDQVNANAQNQDQNTQNQNQSLGWRAGLPDELKNNESFTPYKTVGDFAKAHIETAKKATELAGKLATAIIKPGEGAKPEEVAAYRKALGVPEKPTEYEFPKGEGVEHDPKMIEWAQGIFHKAGLSKESAGIVSQAWDQLIQGMAKDHQQAAETAKAAATEALKKEWGADFDKNLEFTKRGWKKFTDTEFDAFCDESGIGNNPTLIKFVYKIGQAMGEDWTPQGSQLRQGEPKLGINYDKSPAPPKN